MAHLEQQRFCRDVQRRYPHYFTGAHVLDIGSLDINGNNRIFFQDSMYVGLDLGPGPNVDHIGWAHTYFPDTPFDVVISTEAMEHDPYWDLTILHVCDHLLRASGLYVLTCASTNRRPHGTYDSHSSDSPYTNWHYRNITEADVRSVVDLDSRFSDYHIETARDNNDLYFWGILRNSYIHLEAPSPV